MDVNNKLNSINPVRCLVGLILLLLLFLSVKREMQNSETTFGGLFKQGLAAEVAQSVVQKYVPLVAFSKQSQFEKNGFPERQIAEVLPLYGYSSVVQERETCTEEERWESLSVEELLTREGLNGTEMEQVQQSKSIAETQEAIVTEELMQEKVFMPHTLQNPLDLQALASYETLVEQFYTIDANTMAGSEQLDVGKLSSKDLTISKEGEAPRILIYHTHSQEGFADSVPGDVNTTIVGVGAHLSEILQNTYGYQVLHHTGQYDVETRDDAYSQSLPAIEQLLTENPSIEVIIDLHRDSMPEETKLVMDLDGRPTARFMFFNGLSRTKNTGDIAYLYNENLEDNLAFSFQLQRKAVEYYPGLTRKIYLKGYRYNMHLRPRTTLIELGAQNNTVAEAMNACEPLAHIIDMVLSGQ